MKKLLILLFSLLIFNFSFSWEKIRQLDEFGDPTSFYLIGQTTDNSYGILLIGRKEDSEMIAAFRFIEANFPSKKISMKLKSKNGIDEVNGIMNENTILFRGSDSFTIIRALRDSNIVKFNINGTNFGVSGSGFTKLYKEAYSKDFDFDKPSKKPAKGQKTQSLVEGVGEIDADDDIWYY